MVSVPSRQGFVLVTHRDHAAAGADGVEAEGPQSARYRCPRIVRHTPGAGEGLDPWPIPLRLGPRVQASRQRAAHRRAAVSRRHPQARNRLVRRLRHRAAQWCSWAGRDLPRHGQHSDDVRHARLSGRPSRRPDRLAGDRDAAGDRGGPRFLSALPVSGVGHEPCRPRGRRGRQPRHPRDRGGQPLAARQADSRRGRRLEAEPAQRNSRRLGVPVREPALPRRR